MGLEELLLFRDIPAHKQVLHHTKAPNRSVGYLTVSMAY